MAELFKVWIYFLFTLFSCHLLQAKNGFTSDSKLMTDERILISQSHMQFTFRLMSSLVMTQAYNVKSKQLESIVFSPLSIQSILMMIHLGSKGQTKLEISNLLSIDKLNSNSNFSRVHTIFGESVKSLLEDKEISNYLLIANNLFVNKDLRIRKNYKNALKHFHGTSLKSVDFTSTELLELINDWVLKSTKGMIKNFLTTSLSPLTSLIAMNAVYFKGDWLYKFDQQETQNDAFFQLTNGQKVKVPMMVGKFPIAFGEINEISLSASIIELPYKHKRLGLFLTLPNDTGPNGFFNLLRSLNSTTFTHLITSMKKSKKGTEVNVRMPKFEIKSKPDITNVLRNQLGLKSLFNRGEADFSPMFEFNPTSAPLSLNQFSHQAILQINENGSIVSAASATLFERVGLFSDTYFEADRPFLFFLTDKQSGLILFAGIYGGPKPD